jgi:CHAT domain-containing protein/tetratricopeptide (TPR) repeat protein
MRHLARLLPVALVLLHLAGVPASAQVRDAETEFVDQFNRAWEMEKAGKYREALPIFERLYERVPQIYGKDSTNVELVLNHMGILYEALGDNAKAEQSYQRSLRGREAKLGKDDLMVAESLHNLANLYRATSEYAKAEPLYQRSRQIWEAKLGKDDPSVALSLSNQGGLYLYMGEYAKAEQFLQRGLQIREARLGKDHPDVARSLMSLANLYKAMGQYGKVEALYFRCIEIEETKLGKDHPDVALAVNNLGCFYRETGQSAKAELFLQRGLRIRETALGKNHPAVASSLHNLACVCDDLGQYDKAEVLYQRSLKILETTVGKDDPKYALSLNNLAEVYRWTGQYAKAEALYQRSLDIFETKLGKDHPDVADVLNSLANLYRNMGRYANAEPIFQRSLDIYETKLGKDHRLVATALRDLANLYQDMGEYAKAEPLYQRALDIYETQMGKDHPQVADCLHRLAQLNAAQEKWAEAGRLTNRVRQQVRVHACRVLPVLCDREQLVFLENIEAERLNVALSLGLERRKELASTSATWILNAKAIAQESLSDRARMALASTDPQTGQVASQLISIRQQLAATTLTSPRPGQEAVRLQRIASLADQEQQLSRQLGQLIGQASRTDPWVTIEAVRKAVPADGILIEIARFEVKDFKAKGNEKQWKGQHYAAWLVPPAGDGEVQLIDLGDADTIDGAVAAVRQGLLAAQGTAKQKSTILEKGEADAEKDLQAALSKLAKLVLEPLAEHVNDRKQWIVSPDGALWLTPWAALLLKDGSYAIEKHQINYVVSGRDLVAPPFTGKVKPGPSRIMADPDFDLAPKEADALTAKLLGKSPPSAEDFVASLDTATTRSASVIGRVGRLPGTAAEATAIKPKIENYLGEEPWVYRGKNALEGVFKGVHSPKVVVMSTHGFFLENQEVKRSDEQRAALDKDGKLLENPLLRCGLLLAGCNERASATGKQEDGILTGLEIVGCDLRGTELVVLSACETGLGQVHNGEGVAGLRQAFQLAGAQAVVASLWQVSDKDTALLMTDLFDNLAKGKPKAEALREAQLARMKAHRDREGGAHPFYWAAFTLTGQGK